MRPLVLLRVEAQGEPVTVAAAAVAEVTRVVSVAARGPAAHGAAAAEHGRGAGGPPREHVLVIVRARLAHARHLGLAERGGERGLAGDPHPVTVPGQVQATLDTTHSQDIYQKFMQSGFCPSTSSNSVCGRPWRIPQPLWFPSVPSGSNQVLGFIMFPKQIFLDVHFQRFYNTPLSFALKSPYLLGPAIGKYLSDEGCPISNYL